MGLSKDLISQFVKMTNDNKTEKKESTVYGTIRKDKSTGDVSVHIDGSYEADGKTAIYTPIPSDPYLSTTTVKDGDRVSVMIKNHTAVITGNLSSPAPRSADVADATKVSSQISELKTAVANTVSTEELSAESARIDKLVAENVTITKKIDANTADIDELVSDNATIKESLTANSADIDDLKTNKLDIATAIATNVLDITFKTRFSGGILHPILPDRTDLNTVTTPNTYIGKNIASAQYLNVPFESGTFILEVTEFGPEGQLRQTINICYKERIEELVRFYYSDSWGEWIDTTRFDGTILWSGGMYMEASHTVTLSEKVSKQRNGIVLVFSEYLDGTVSDTAFTCHFIPKEVVSLKSGCGHTFILSSFNLETVGIKYLYVKDDSISGHDNNVKTGTAASGIVYSNNKFVMRYVIGI